MRVRTHMLGHADKLREAANFTEERGKTYGANYWQAARIMSTLFPDGMTLKTDMDFMRFQFIEHIVNKLTRGANAWRSGAPPHLDSSWDMSVYAMMLHAAEGLAARGDNGEARLCLCELSSEFHLLDGGKSGCELCNGGEPLTAENIEGMIRTYQERVSALMKGMDEHESNLSGHRNDRPHSKPDDPARHAAGDHGIFRGGMGPGNGQADAGESDQHLSETHEIPDEPTGDKGNQDQDHQRDASDRSPVPGNRGEYPWPNRGG